MGITFPERLFCHLMEVFVKARIKAINTISIYHQIVANIYRRSLQT